MPFLICDLCKVRKNCTGKGFVEGSIVQCLMVSAILHIPKSPTKFNVHSLDLAGLFLFAWKRPAEKFGVQRAAVIGTGRRRPRRGWATSTKGPARPVDFCYKCVGFVKRLAKYTVLCYDCKPKRKARNLHKAALQGSKPQHFRRRSFAGPTSFCTKRSPYAFIRKNKRAFPPPYGAGRS